jgi:2-C-methyl-D-erythritol 4-phosphate cytidylyltransferase
MDIPIIIHTINIFKEIEEVDSVVVVVHAEWFSYTKEIIEKYKAEKVDEIIVGGKTRQMSVSNALHSKIIADSDIILVHDSVRPFSSPALVKKIIETADEFGAAIPATTPKETIKERTGQGIVTRTIDRTKLCNVQTPQGFWQDIIQNAYQKANNAGYEGTDDSSLVEFIGYKVKVVDGEDNNLKITTPFDLKVSELLFREQHNNK